MDEDGLASYFNYSSCISMTLGKKQDVFKKAFLS